MFLRNSNSKGFWGLSLGAIGQEPHDTAEHKCTI